MKPVQLNDHERQIHGCDYTLHNENSHNGTNT